MRHLVHALAAVLVLLALPSSASADIAVETESPVASRPLTLTVTHDGAPVPGATVEVAYMPGSEVEWTVAEGTTDAQGSVTFEPDRFGLVRVTVGDDTTVLSVRAGSMPMGAVAVFLFAAGLLSTLLAAGFRGIFASGHDGATSGAGPGTTSSAG